MCFLLIFIELQLKPSHVPFKLVAFWEELLEKYTVTSEEDMERGGNLLHFYINFCLIAFFYPFFLDEPVLIFRRNVFMSRNEESSLVGT